MLSQTCCCWYKQQPADTNIIQLHLKLKCTKDQYFHFCDCFLVSKWVFQHHDHCLTKFHAGSAQRLMCVVISNSSYPTFTKNNTAYHAFGKHWIQARGFLNYRLKYCWPKVIHYTCLGLPDGRYFTSTLEEAGKRPVFWKSVPETGIVNINNLP